MDNPDFPPIDDTTEIMDAIRLALKAEIDSDQASEAEPEKQKPLNTPHVVTVGAPLLRPGLTISATCSEKYVATVAARLMEIVRAINRPGQATVTLPECLRGGCGPMCHRDNSCPSMRARG